MKRKKFMKDTITYSSQNGSFTWRRDPFDSQILSMSIAKIIDFEASPNNQKNLAGELTASFQEHTISYAVYRFPANNFSTIHALEENNWLLVDGSIHLDLKLTKQPFDIPSNIRLATSEDVPQLQTIARTSFTFNRYFNDPLISKTAANEIYAEWIKNSINNHLADAVFVYFEIEKLYGFATLKKDGDIVLVAVDPQQQGRSIGRHLVAAAINQCIQWNLPTATIETQLTNIPALRSFQSTGFKIKETLLTFRWSVGRAKPLLH
jgi:ribosomal protein S18 acetylase RimI-like enzyme